MDFVEILGLTAGLLTSISSFPQLIKIIKEKKAEDVSKLMFWVLVAGVGLWIVYGFMKNDLPIIITNIVSLVINFIVLILRYKYAKKD
jgi:MtN3 and saliva related transmembrane protein